MSRDATTPSAQPPPSRTSVKTDRTDFIRPRSRATGPVQPPSRTVAGPARMGRRPWSILLPALSAMLLVVAACGAGEEEGSAGEARGQGFAREASREGGAMGGADRAIPVAGEVAEARELEVTLRASANLRAREEVEVLPKQQGVVSRILVEEGASVREGELLAQLDDEEWRLQLRQAESRARAARDAVERARALQEQGLFSDQEVEGLESEASVAQADLELAELRVRNARIVAPIDGVVTHRHVERGQLVSSTSPAFVVADMSALQARVGIPERQAGRVEVGQRVRVQAEEGDGPPASGRVARVRPVVDPATGTVQVTVELDAAASRILQPGRFVNVDIVTETLPDRLTVPRTAVLVDGPTPRIYVVRDGRGEERDVELGVGWGDRVEIRSGLSPGDTVVVVGQDNLRPGVPVRLMELDGDVVRSGGPEEAGGERPTAPGMERPGGEGQRPTPEGIRERREGSDRGERPSRSGGDRRR